MSAENEILVVPKIGQGHLFPCIELCKHLLRRDFRITVVAASDISSSIPSTLQRSHLFALINISPPQDTPPDPPANFPRQHQQMAQGIESFLAARDPARARPVCAVIDHIMYKTQEVFSKLGIPTVTFITSGACWAAVQHAAYVVRPDDMKPGEARALPGLPNEMVLSYSDLKQRRHWMPSNRGGGGGGGGRDPGGSRTQMGPPLPGQPAPWVEEVQSSVALLINTCDDLERPFLDYMANLTGKPVWGVGPLLPEEYWRSAASLLREREIRPKRESNYSDDEIIGWLDRQPRGSVMYVSFGSEVGPSTEEYPELAKALEESNRPFIWVIQKKSGRPGPPGGGPAQMESSYFPHGLDGRVGRGADHTRVGAAAADTEPPINRGDQYYNAKLVVNHLKIGALVCDEYPAEMVTKDHVLKGIERVLTDEEITRRSMGLGERFEKGFPESSVSSMDAFRDFVNRKTE
ncbi:hypothetical protein NL676_009766 [Syzygium grande]|nr:hypothetical protein NL676_009766 [Syzygium grande]